MYKRLFNSAGFKANLLYKLHSHISDCSDEINSVLIVIANIGILKVPS